MRYLISCGAPLKELTDEHNPWRRQFMERRGRVTALHLAARKGRADNVAVLLAAGADARWRDTRGRTPADLARGNGKADVARMLEAAVMFYRGGAR